MRAVPGSRRDRGRVQRGRLDPGDPAADRSPAIPADHQPSARRAARRSCRRPPVRRSPADRGHKLAAHRRSCRSSTPATARTTAARARRAPTTTGRAQPCTNVHRCICTAGIDGPPTTRRRPLQASRARHGRGQPPRRSGPRAAPPRRSRRRPQPGDPRRPPAQRPPRCPGDRGCDRRHLDRGLHDHPPRAPRLVRCPGRRSVRRSLPSRQPRSSLRAERRHSHCIRTTTDH